MNTQSFNFEQFFLDYGLDSRIFRKFLSFTGIELNYEKGPWIAGGALRRAVSRQPANGSDIDLFFKHDFQRKNVTEKLLSCGYEVVLVTEHSCFLRLKEEFIYEGCFSKVNLVFINYYDSAIDLINSFDYTICQFATDLKTLISGEFSLFDLANKRLRIHEITYPNASLRRMIKYSKQGFTACDGTITNFILTVREMDEEQINLNYRYID